MKQYFKDPLWMLASLFVVAIAIGFSTSVTWWSGPAIVVGFLALSYFMRNNP